MTNIFLKLLNMSVTASYVALVVIVVRILMKRAPKIYSYVLWLAVLFRALSPISFSSSLSLLGRLNVSNESIPMDIGMMPIPQVNTSIAPMDNAINNSLPAATHMASVNPMQVLIAFGAIAWLIGFSIMIIYSIYSYYKVNKNVQFATLIKDNIYETDQIRTPFVLGVIKPKIYLPINLKENQRDYIISHEKVHIRRLDHIIKPLYFIALSIHWFNPIIWLSYFLMIKDMEMSCDERVMKECDEDVRDSYSITLLNISINQSKILHPLGFGESNIKSRIKNIMNYRKPRFWIFIVGIIVGILASSLIANPRGNTPEAMAKRFLKEYYIIVNTDIVDMLFDPSLMDSIASSDYDESRQGLIELRNVDSAISVKYGSLMTDYGFEAAAASRVILEGEQTAKDNGSKLYVFQTKLSREEIPNSENVRFSYNVAAILTIKDKTTEIVNLNGNLTMKNVDGDWKVDRFSPSRLQLSNILKEGIPYLYIINDSDANVIKVEVQNKHKLDRIGVMKADGKPLKKGKEFIFDMNSAANINFFVTVLDEGSVLAKQEFTEDFSNGKDVYLYIRKDESGEIFLEKDSAGGVLASLDNLLNFIDKILMPNPKPNTPKAIAEEFITTYYTIENTDIADMVDDESLWDKSGLDENGLGIISVIGIDEAVEAKYAEFMTEDALKRAGANRTILMGEFTAKEYGSRMTIEHVNIWDEEVADNGDITYQYNVPATVRFKDGSKEHMNLQGKLVMKEIDGKWKIADFKINVMELEKVLQFGKSFLTITNHSNASIRKVEVSTKENSSQAMNGDDIDMYKYTGFDFDMTRFINNIIDEKNLDFTVRLLDGDKNILLEQNFIGDFSEGKDVHIYIQEDKEGNLEIKNVN